MEQTARKWPVNVLHEMYDRMIVADHVLTWLVRNMPDVTPETSVNDFRLELKLRLQWYLEDMMSLDRDNNDMADYKEMLNERYRMPGILKADMAKWNSVAPLIGDDPARLTPNEEIGIDAE